MIKQENFEDILTKSNQKVSDLINENIWLLMSKDQQQNFKECN